MFRRSVASPGWLVALALGAAGVLSLSAQDRQPYRIGVGVGYRADADIDNGGGDFNETRLSVSGSRMFQMNEKLLVEPILTYRFGAYDFSRRELWDDVHTFRATALVRYAIDEHWGIWGGPSIGVAGESDADVGDAMTFGGALAANYRVSPDLAIGAGFTVSTEIEDTARVRPLVIVNWQINDRWSFESGYLEVAGGGGLGGEVRYKIAEAWSVAAGLQYHEKRFRLSDDGRVHDGVGEDSSWPIFARLTWQVCPNGALELIGGVAVGGELRLENRKGHTLHAVDYDPAPLVGLRALLTF